MDPLNRLSSAKRRREEEEEDEFSTVPKKMSHGVEEEAINDMDLELLGDLDEEAIARLVDAAPETEKIDAAGVKRLVLNFETAYTENTKMREKYADEPAKFVESELALHTAIRDMQSIATGPEHYIELLRNGTHDSILSLLSHDNTDMVISVIDLLRDFLAADDDGGEAELGELDEEDDRIVQRELITETMRVFTAQLLKLDMIPLLVACIARFDENVAEEKQGVYDTLELFENLLDVALDESCELILTKTKFVQWLLLRLASSKFGDFDDVKLYASEILCILAQSSLDIQQRIGKDNGIDILLQTLSKYRKVEPSVAEEKEMIENICNVLCVTVVHTDNRKLFLQAEGLDLLKLLLKSGRYCNRGATKILSFFLPGDVEASCKWLDIGGLGSLFSAFMHQSRPSSNPSSIKKKNKKNQTEFEDEEHILSILAALLTNFKDAIVLAQSNESSTSDIKSSSETSNSHASLPHDTSSTDKYMGYIERICLKFAENNCEKLERLVQLHHKYSERMQVIDTKLMAADNDDEARDADDEEQVLQDRLEAGLFALQLVDYILVFVSNSLPVVKDRASKLLKSNNSHWSEVKAVLMEYAGRSATQNDEDPEAATGEAEYIRGLAESLNE